MAFKLSEIVKRLFVRNTGMNSVQAAEKKGLLPQIFQLSIWVWLLLLGIVTTGCLIWASVHQSMQISLQLHVLNQLSMQAQRIAKTAAYSTEGQAAAFDQMTESRDAFAGGLHLLLDGGNDGKGHHFYLPSAEDVVALQDIQRSWHALNQSILQIQSKKQVLTDVHTVFEQIDVLLPSFLALRKDVFASNNALWSKERLDVMTVLLLDTVYLYGRILSKDITMRDQLFEQLSSALNEYKQLVSAIGHEVKKQPPQASEKQQLALIKSLDELDNYSQLLTALANTLPHLMEVRRIEDSIQSETEALNDSLTDMIDEKESLLSAHGWLFWPVQIAILFTVVCALGIVRERLRISQQHTAEAEFQRRQAEQQKRLAQQQEEKAKQLHEQNKQALMVFTQELTRLSDGDLTVQLEESDDLIGSVAMMMNQSVLSIKGLVRKVIEIADLVSVTTNSLGNSIMAVVDVSRRQSAAIRETGGSIQEIATQMTQISESANESVDVAKQSLLAAERGAKAVEDSVRGMYDIRDHIKETSQRIKRLGESSQEIGEVTDLIADIAEQTNVVAMNAFIQAASAGEAGKGFTVVAEEIQRLAERSNEATKQISALIKMIQVDTHDAIAAMERSTVGVVEGSKLTDAAGMALSDIRQVSNQLADLIRHFSSATQSQALLIRRVASTMQNMLESNIRIEEGRERFGQNYRELEGVARQLKNSVSRFRTSS